MSLQIGTNARTRPDLSRSIPVTKPTRKSDDLGWTVRLLRTTHLGISLFRLKLHGPGAAAGGIDMLIDRLGEETLVEQLDDGSALLLVIRFEDSEENVTARLSSHLAAAMRAHRWPPHSVVELIGVHHHAAEVGHVADLLTELSYAPRRVIQPGSHANL